MRTLGSQRVVGAALVVMSCGCGGTQDAPFAPPIDVAQPAAPTEGPKTLQIAAPDGLDAALVEKRPFHCAGAVAFEVEGRRYCVQQTALPWREAEERCVDRGGHLAALGSEAESVALQRALRSPFHVDEAVWIGLVEPSEGRWVWADLQPAHFTQWASGEPNNAGDENCGEMYTVDATWNDARCDERRSFLCERRPLPPGQVDTRPTLACPASGISVIVDGIAYCLDLGRRLSWQQALAACKAAGGALAQVESPRIAEGLRQAFGARAGAARLWIGHNDRAQEGSWRWSSGEPTTHTRWRVGEPNNVGDEDCVEWFTIDAGWNDAICALPRFSLCEEP